VATLTYRALHGSAPLYLASSFACVADMPHRRRLRSDLSSVNCRRSRLSCCCSKGVEWPTKRCYVGLVAVGVQEQAVDILVPPLLRNCLTLMTFPFLVIISTQNSGPCNSFYCLGHFKNVYDDDDDDDDECGSERGGGFNRHAGASRLKRGATACC